MRSEAKTERLCSADNENDYYNDSFGFWDWNMAVSTGNYTIGWTGIAEWQGMTSGSAAHWLHHTCRRRLAYW